MSTDKTEFFRLLREPEDENLEFKSALNQFDSRRLLEYCAALANEGGGYLILGVSDKLPREISGTNAFRNINKLKSDIGQRLPQLRVDVQELYIEDKRVLLVKIPQRPVGLPVALDGKYLMRRGEELVSMTPDLIKSILDETGPDFSATICPGATFTDLDTAAISRFREMWHRSSNNSRILMLDDLQLLSDAELTYGDQVTFAALILLGTPSALGQFLGQAEVIFEYRNDPNSTPYSQRKTYRTGFLTFIDDLWETVNLRNETYSYQSGLFRYQIPTFNEEVVREALLNALSHRDYRKGDSIRVLQSPHQLAAISPGGFPNGITLENIHNRHSPRNKRLSEQLERCGLVERSGQGVNRMFEAAIREAKPPPDFSDSDEFQVTVSISGAVPDTSFLAFLEKIGEETLTSFSTDHFLVMDYVHREQSVPPYLRHVLSDLRDRGIIEVISRGRGARYLLARKFYEFAGQPAAYTRKRGLDRKASKQLLLQHIQEHRENGCALSELVQVVPFLGRGAVQQLLRELRNEGSIHNRGMTRASRWYPSGIS